MTSREIVMTIRTLWGKEGWMKTIIWIARV